MLDSLLAKKKNIFFDDTWFDSALLNHEFYSYGSGNYDTFYAPNGTI
jgi:hypothetical protein